jgi:hypothetical protein
MNIEEINEASFSKSWETKTLSKSSESFLSLLYIQFIWSLVLIFFQIKFNLSGEKLNNKFNGCYTRVRIVLGIYTNRISVEPRTALRPNTPWYRTVVGRTKRFRERRQDTYDRFRYGTDMTWFTFNLWRYYHWDFSVS